MLTAKQAPQQVYITVRVIGICSSSRQVSLGLDDVKEGIVFKRLQLEFLQRTGEDTGLEVQLTVPVPLDASPTATWEFDDDTAATLQLLNPGITLFC